MNEKFKQLVLEAKMATADFDAGSYYVATPHQMQKLCELIVQHCASQVRFTDLLLCNKDEDNDNEILLQASVQLKRHFGVEQ
jgi:hypothetical protein